MLKDFKPRLYQETIFQTAAKANTLIVLPTGLGKTNIFVMLALHRLTQYPSSKILLLGPTRPLIDQYRMVFERDTRIPKEDMAVFTGMVKPEKREELWKGARVVFSTPQAIENDILTKRISLENVSLVGFDEAHRAAGDYSYVLIAKQYLKTARFPRTVGLTASPGSDPDRIREVMENLAIEELEVRTDNDPDVRQYIQDVKIEWRRVDLPADFKRVKDLLEASFKSKLKQLKEHGVIDSAQVSNFNRKDILTLQARLQGEVARGNKDYEILKSMSLAAEAMKVQHGLELIETQGLTPVRTYLEGMLKQAATSKVKAVQNLSKDQNFTQAAAVAASLSEKGLEHPKLTELKSIIREETEKSPKVKIIVFNQYRESLSEITNTLNLIPSVMAEMFVGQAKRNGTGLTQKEQLAKLERFRAGEFNVICMSSVGEEGLDIPQVDLVVFFEPVPSAIRQIQRRGRTGRQEKGRVIVLMTRNTRDEAYHYVARNKEKRMFSTLKALTKTIKGVSFKQPTLDRYVGDDGVKVFADHREKSSAVIKELIDLGCDLKLDTLDSADYLLSSRVGVEYKTVKDFVNSLVDGRLLEQVRSLKERFARPIIIVEGEDDIYSVRNVHPNAIRGLIATIAVSYGIPLIATKGPKDTAALLRVIARREQEETGKDFHPHSEKRAMTPEQQQEFIAASLPGVGGTLAKPLLRHFKTIKTLANAPVEELEKVEKIGKKKAQAIRDILDREY